MTTHINTERPTGVVPLLDRKMVLALLGLIVVVGGLSGILRLFMGLGATTNLQDSYSWGIWIGFDFTLIAFAGAGFTMAAWVHVLRQHTYHDVVRPAILAGLMGYVAVLLLLVLDLGRPDRFYNFILFWNPHSPLFEISWCVLLYTTVLVVETSPFVLERLGKFRAARIALKIATWIMLPVTILGVTLSSLHQSTLGTLYLNMPHRLHALWYTPALPVLFFVSSIMAGFSLATLAYTAATRFTGRETKPQIVYGLTKVAGWVTLFYLVLKLGDLLVAGELPLIFTAGAYSFFWWLEMGLGAILPAALLLVPRWSAKRWVPVVAPLLILFGVMMNRFNATMFGQILPPETSYNPHLMEWLSTAGIILAAMLAWYLGIRFLNIFEDHTEHHQ